MFDETVDAAVFSQTMQRVVDHLVMKNFLFVQPDSDLAEAVRSAGVTTNNNNTGLAEAVRSAGATTRTQFNKQQKKVMAALRTSTANNTDLAEAVRSAGATTKNNNTDLAEAVRSAGATTKNNQYYLCY